MTLKSTRCTGLSYIMITSCVLFLVNVSKEAALQDGGECADTKKEVIYGDNGEQRALTNKEGDLRPNLDTTVERTMDEKSGESEVARNLRLQRETLSVSTMPPIPEDKFWFMEGGQKWPKRGMVPDSETKLWPEEDPGGDRIVAQLMYIPQHLKQTTPIKKILIFDTPEWPEPYENGREEFLSPKRCPVSSCTLTDERAEAETADAVVFREMSADLAVANPNILFSRPREQIWVLHFWEGPYRSPHLIKTDFNPAGGIFNWTATYRRDSDIVVDYGKWIYYDENVKEKPQSINYAANKTKMVAWIVSNCEAKNDRLQYAQELSKHIQVDIYGKCGSKMCPISSSEECFLMLDRYYKFYLAFENANCKDYITEKLFVNALRHNVLPIVMGAPPEDYAQVAPQGSYIHVEDFSGPKDLAKYLKYLDADDEAYNNYFRWKGTGELFDSRFLCRLCAMLHDDRPNGAMQHRMYEDINTWWRSPGICTLGSWKNMRKSRD